MGLDMTKEQAISILDKIIKSSKNRDRIGMKPSDFIDAFIQLGMLKVDDSTTEKLDAAH